MGRQVGVSGSEVTAQMGVCGYINQVAGIFEPGPPEARSHLRCGSCGPAGLAGLAFQEPLM